MPPDSKILIVDDHKDTLFALESALAALNYELTCVTSGDDALKEILRGDIGLVLLDVRMPGSGGLDVVRYMRRLEQTQYIPILLLTGFGMNRDLAAAAFLLGVADVVLKPVDPWMLRTKVRYLYESYRRTCALQRELDALRANGAPAPPVRGRRSREPDGAQPRVPSQPTAASHESAVRDRR
ncbi:response regulator [Streptomyces silaceus]|uniref:response regulator n=1 Tax=Streptomyces silaceus TaxID=545123 RepID=UPI00099E4792|nr:response regulator [Streptomyces silaceus]